MIAFAFCLATAVALFQGILFPGFCLFAYAPWIALVNLRCHFVRAIWLSAMAGVCLDLLSDHPFGVHGIAYVGTSLLLFRFRKHLLAEKPLHLGLYSAFVSWTATLLLLFLLFLFDRRIPFAGRWVLADLFTMPLVDGLYALVWFSGPLALFVKLRRQWGLFWLRRKSPSHT